MKIKIKQSYRYYRCTCGRKVIPLTSPCKCPHCGRITYLR